MENVTDAGEAGIDESAPVVSRHSVTVTASADTVWRILTDIDAWTTWLPEIPYAHIETPGPLAPGSVFRWSAAGMEIESTVAQVWPRDRLVWRGYGGGQDGVLGVHVWALTPAGDGVEVSTEESFAGPPVDADPATFQAGLDTTLAMWLHRLKITAEAATAS
ncbi:SRPBCC family protein [Sphaerisporangium sp. TRM90804]|uniref:SRPBCC family protein n=1 Tax=Sphaerisporangium sp. TRM90804 TaxID=3031113 RepID=UPI002446AC8E|nr:SRPBCC family protein [Sphaerisporangium sp. TRM90804]MDH2426415.1 SRPBCC family protein [Sphaerisporangium sp. TRM90804]